MKTTVACILMMAPASSTTLLICIRRTAYGGFPLRWPRSFEQNFRVAKWIVSQGVKLPSGGAADRSRLDPGCGRQERREVALRCTTKLKNAHRTEFRELLYPFHPWSGSPIAIHEAIDKPDGVVFRCDMVDSDSDRWQEIPAWM